MVDLNMRYSRLLMKVSGVTWMHIQDARKGDTFALMIHKTCCFLYGGCLPRITNNLYWYY